MAKFQPKILLLAFLVTGFFAISAVGFLEIALRVTGFRFSLPILEEMRVRNLLDDAGEGNVEIAKDLADPEIYGRSVMVRTPNGKFPLKKSPKRTRVILLGDSTGVVFLMDPEPFNQCINKNMKRPIELISLSFSGCGSDRTVETMRQIANLEADFIWVSTGHSDYVSMCNPDSFQNNGLALSSLYSRSFYWAFRHLRSLQLFAKISAFVARKYMAIEGNRRNNSFIQRAYSEKEKEQFRDKFESNMREIARLAKARSIPILFTTMAYNYDIGPFWEIKMGNGPNNPRAVSLYQEGMKLRSEGKMSEARKALDESYAVSQRPFTATYITNGIIQKVAIEEGAILVDVKKIVDAESKDGFVGNELMQDHCHFNRKGNTIFSLAVCEAITQRLRAPSESTSRPQTRRSQ